MSNKNLILSTGRMQGLTTSDSMDINEIANMVADRVSMNKVEVNKVLAEALGDFRGEMYVEENIVMKETYQEDGKSLNSREVLVSQRTSVTRE